MTDPQVLKIQRHPGYRELRRRRNSLGITLTLLMLLVYYGYIALIAFDKALLSRPIADLNLSVRARKCMIRLGINSISELVRRTGDDLLECKNFGVTSLNEVREKLQVHGLKLRGD